MKLNPDEDAMRQTHKAVWSMGAALSCGAFYFGGGQLALSTFVGAALAGVNLLVLTRTVRNLLAGFSASWGGVAAGKFLALMGATYLALNNDFIEPLGFALGIGALPLGIVFSSLFFSPTGNPKHRALG